MRLKAVALAGALFACGGGDDGFVPYEEHREPISWYVSGTQLLDTGSLGVGTVLCTRLISERSRNEEWCGLGDSWELYLQHNEEFCEAGALTTARDVECWAAMWVPESRIDCDEWINYGGPVECDGVFL